MLDQINTWTLVVPAWLFRRGHQQVLIHLLVPPWLLVVLVSLQQDQLQHSIGQVLEVF